MNLLGTILLFLVGSSPAQAMTGTVRSSAGESLADVFVFFGRGVGDIERTKADGTFSVSRHGSYVAFLREGYRPVIRLIEPSRPVLDVVLEQGQSTEWNVPSCKTLKNPGKRIGFLLKFPVPQGAKTRQGTDVDYSTFGLGVLHGREWSWIEGGVGPNWAPAGPTEELLRSAAEFIVRSYRAEKWSGFDVRGRSTNGEYWRYLGWVGQSVNYRVSSQEQAAVLDKIIEGACY